MEYGIRRPAIQREMKVKIAIFTCLLLFSSEAYSQQVYTGSNKCLIEITTNIKRYRFSTANMSAHLNEVLDRLEFVIPVSSVEPLGDPSDVEFVQSFSNGQDCITINAGLPDEKDAQVDLSYFKGTKAWSLAGDINIGRFTFKDYINFNGMLIEGIQKMAFGFSIFLNEQGSSAARLGDEQIIEIKLAARGDKIIGLTSN